MFQLISSKAQLEKEVGRLWDRVHLLWERLDVPHHEQELFSEGKKGFKPVVIEAVSWLHDSALNVYGCRKLDSDINP